MKPAVLLLPMLALSCAAPDGAVEAVRNNGHQGRLSIQLPGVPAVGQPFVAELFRRERAAGCTQDAAACAQDVPLRHLTARCDDPAVCGVPAQDLTPLGGRFQVRLLGNHVGTTTVQVDAVTEDGRALHDSFCVRVVRPVEMEVDCPGCGDATGAATDPRVSCRLYNRAESSLPLQALCDATSASGAVAVERALPDWLPPAWDAPDAPATVRGTSFVVRRMTGEAGRIWFHQGALRQVLNYP